MSSIRPTPRLVAGTLILAVLLGLGVAIGPGMLSPTPPAPGPEIGLTVPGEVREVGPQRLMDTAREARRGREQAERGRAGYRDRDRRASARSASTATGEEGPIDGADREDGQAAGGSSGPFPSATPEVAPLAPAPLPASAGTAATAQSVPSTPRRSTPAPVPNDGSEEFAPG